jgi:predicted N-formylglutamate amidohydrolase
MDALIDPDEEPIVEMHEGSGPFVIACEHASNRLPRALGSLGLSPSDLQRHIAWDPGAADVADGLAVRLSADLVKQRFSRLAIDCNRSPELPDAIATISEDTAIPGNHALTAEARATRISAFWAPFHAALDKMLDRRRSQRRPTALVTVHSFTPVFRGVARPWHIGIISTDERRLADAVLAVLRRDRTVVVGDNQPYSARDNVDYTIRRHGRDRGLPHVMIEIRNDLLRAARDITAWTEVLTGALLDGAAALELVPAKAQRRRDA